MIVDIGPDFQPVVLGVQTERLLSLLEEIHLHITESFLELRDLLLTLTHFPLQLVLRKYARIILYCEYSIKL